MMADLLPFDLDDDADDEDRRAFVRLWTFLQRTETEREQSYDVDAEWEALSDRLDLDAEPEAGSSERRAADRPAQPKQPTQKERLQGWTRGVALTVLLLGFIGAGLWWGGTASVQTAAGERTVVSLPDGSTAELNGATTLTYRRGFTSLPFIEESVRAVHLDGEAFFSVTDSNRPFRVETENARVEVLGTAFNVRARREQDTPHTQVVVAEGRVRLNPSEARSNPSAAVVLDDHSQASRIVGPDGTPTAPHRIDRKYVGAWREGGFAMAGASVPTILRELERRFGTPVKLKAPAATTDTMTLHYDRDVQLETVLHDISLIQNLSYRKTSQGYELVQEES